MESEGIKVSVDGMNELSKYYLGLIDSYKNKIFQACGKTFNINSPKLLYFRNRNILFLKLRRKIHNQVRRRTINLHRIKIYKLATIDRNCDLAIDLKDCAVPNKFCGEVKKLFAEFELKIKCTACLKRISPPCRQIAIPKTRDSVPKYL